MLLEALLIIYQRSDKIFSLVGFFYLESYWGDAAGSRKCLFNFLRTKFNWKYAKVSLK